MLEQPMIEKLHSMPVATSGITQNRPYGIT